MLYKSMIWYCELCLRKGCKIYAVWVTHLVLNENQTHISDHLVLSEFRDLFLEEIPRLPPQQEIGFSIVIILGPMPVSKIPYWMSIPK